MPKEIKSLADVVMDLEPEARTKLPILQTTIAIAVSLATCKFSIYLKKLLGFKGGSLHCITTIVVMLATIFPSQFGFLAPAGEAVALIMMQVVYFLLKASIMFDLLFLLFFFLRGLACILSFSFYATAKNKRPLWPLSSGQNFIF